MAHGLEGVFQTVPCPFTLWVREAADGLEGLDPGSFVGWGQGDGRLRPEQPGASVLGKSGNTRSTAWRLGTGPLAGAQASPQLSLPPVKPVTNLPTRIQLHVTNGYILGTDLSRSRNSIEYLSLPKTPSALSGKDLRQVAPAAPPLEPFEGRACDRNPESDHHLSQNAVQ